MNEIAAKIAEYFKDTDQITIDQVFVPGNGWDSWRESQVQPTLTELRSLRRFGATAVAVRAGNRIADFQIDEVLAYAERPLFGGNVI